MKEATVTFDKTDAGYIYGTMCGTFVELKSRLNLSSYSFCDKDVINFAFRDNFFLFLAFRDKNVTIYDFYRENVV